MLPTKRYKILHVASHLKLGGLETVTMELCLCADHSQFDTEILCLNKYDDQFMQRVIDAGIPVHLLEKRYRFDFGFFSRVARFIRDKQVDVIHAHSGCYFYAALFTLLAGVKTFIYTAHGLPILLRLQDRIEDNIATLIVDTIVPVSEEIEEALVRWMPFSRPKMRLIINGVDTERFHPQPELRRRPEMIDKYGLSPEFFWIGSVGRLEPEKNYSMLLQALACANKRPGPTIKLALVGDGSQMRALQELAATLGIERQTLFLGKQLSVHEILPLLDVFVLSSLTEGTSISLLEAQACGVPAVVTDVGGNGFIIRHGENGFLCPLNDIEAMASSLCRIRDEPDMAKNMAQASCRRVETGLLNLNSVIKQYQDLYLQKK
ncbi:MAG: glycosyltransferase [Desulfobulbaceae bacterium]|jgi:glycosyltransferase involved in cell wall biosynthesis|nr:glycosyltransferase [Desulfobulbaceae bacterium]